MEILKQLFEQHFHSPATQVQPLQGELGGSGRNIIRLANEQHKAIGIVYGVREENAAFLEFSKTFRRHGLPVPQIYEEDLDHGAYLEEDLGDLTLFQFLSQNRHGDDVAPEAIASVDPLAIVSVDPLAHVAAPVTVAPPTRSKTDGQRASAVFCCVDVSLAPDAHPAGLTRAKLTAVPPDPSWPRRARTRALRRSPQ